MSRSRVESLASVRPFLSVAIYGLHRLAADKEWKRKCMWYVRRVCPWKWTEVLSGRYCTIQGCRERPEKEFSEIETYPSSFYHVVCPHSFPCLSCHETQFDTMNRDEFQKYMECRRRSRSCSAARRSNGQAQKHKSYNGLADQAQYSLGPIYICVCHPYILHLGIFISSINLGLVSSQPHSHS